MMGLNLLAASIFSPGQLAAIIVIAVVLFLLLVANGVLLYIFHKRGERKLCTSQLQSKRDELLSRLESMKSGNYEFPAAVEQEEAADDAEALTDDEDDDDDEEEEKPAATVETMTTEGEEGEEPIDAEIFAVADMSAVTRQRLGFADDEYDRKRYYVRFTFGFEAKLRLADDEVKARYTALCDEIALYKGVKIKGSFRQQRIYKGRKTLGIILFRGKTLCVAFALNPADYAETKYRGIDKSDKKRFAKTPMLYKLTSTRRVEYAKYLLVQLADLNTIVMEENAQPQTYDLAEKTRDEMFVANMSRITILGEAPELEPEPEPELILEETTEGPVVEAAATETEEEDEIAVETAEGRIVFNRSFTARITQADDALKARYSELKNYILGYKGVRSRISWKRETFSLGRNTMATFSIRGKTLCVYLAADPVRFEDTKYKVENLSEQSSRRKTPLLFRVKSDRRTAYAKQLIDLVLTENNAVRVERKPVDYTVPYKSTDTLVKRGLIRITQSNSTFNRPPQNK